MKLSNSEKFKVGDEHTVDLLPAKNGGRPICRIDGAVAFLSKNSKGFFKPGSTWMVKVAEVHEKHLVVDLLIQTHSAKENNKLMEERLKNEFGKKKVKQSKPKNRYNYLSSNELRNLEQSLD